MLLDKRSALNFEWPLAAAVLALCGMGLVILYSAGFDPETQMSVPMKRQAAAMGVGWAAFLAIGFLSVNFWKRWAFILFGFGCMLLAIIDTVGIAAGGARRWLDLGGGVRM
ncbi:MAG: FtsW/RodA/SpoVE family cell cycle protein, partial [Deltaproteobacteria bacterium]|nr:FtsW/RodA/SpoVE family cell cycle protein [Deltaproteobacteria bacterium]